MEGFCECVWQIQLVMIRLSIVHWLPLEQYPPAQNMLQYFTAVGGYGVCCCTSIRANERSPVSIPNVDLFRGSFPVGSDRGIIKLIKLMGLFWAILKGLLLSRPDVILYVEPHSALPVAMYLILRPSTRLFVHYHEYREPSHFRDRGNLVARIGRWCETCFLHRRAEWISHTNDDRLKMFLQDHPDVRPDVLRSLPNYPPGLWLPVIAKNLSDRREIDTVRLVYVGALSLRDTFIRPLLEWITIHQSGPRILLDIYAGSMDSDTRQFLETVDVNGVQVYFAGVPYGMLPQILPHYDIGLILYRGNSFNYRYNAPNKLFEYLLCGLDVWYPSQMPGIRPVAATIVEQNVVELNFEDPAALDRQIQSGITRKSREWSATCEDVLRTLHQSIVHNQQAVSPPEQRIGGAPRE